MQSVVAMFCGPHDEGNVVPRRRIDKAVEAALEHQVPLLIAGDGNNHRDVTAFMEIARFRGVRHVIGLYDPEANTLSDAVCVAKQVNDNPEFARVRRIYLVTDFWHMPRAKMMLETVCIEYALQLDVISSPVTSGPMPPEAVLLGERQGIEDFLAGRYGLRKAHDPYGKPCSGT